MPRTYVHGYKRLSCVEPRSRPASARSVGGKLAYDQEAPQTDVHGTSEAAAKFRVIHELEQETPAALCRYESQTSEKRFGVGLACGLNLRYERC